MIQSLTWNSKCMNNFKYHTLKNYTLNCWHWYFSQSFYLSISILIHVFLHLSLNNSYCLVRCNKAKNSVCLIIYLFISFIRHSIYTYVCFFHVDERILVHFIHDTYTILIYSVQYVSVLHWLEYSKRFKINRLYRQFRPRIPVSSSVRSWFRYAIVSVLEHNIRPYTWLRIKQYT